MCRTLTAMLLAAALAVPVAADEPRGIAVPGRGSVTAVPDQAEIAVAVTARAIAPNEAIRDVARRMRTVLDALDAAGIAAPDRQTRHVALQPVQSRDEPGTGLRVVGYLARQNLAVTVRDLPVLGAVLDALVTAGADEIGGIAFESSERAALLDIARREAVADARRTAELLADAAGATLGPVQAITLAGDFGAPRLAMRAMADEAMPVAPGEITIRAEVQVVFAID